MNLSMLLQDHAEDEIIQIDEEVWAPLRPLYINTILIKCLQMPFCLPINLNVTLTSPTVIIPLEASFNLWGNHKYEHIMFSLGTLQVESKSPTEIELKVLHYISHCVSQAV